MKRIAGGCGMGSHRARVCITYKINLDAPGDIIDGQSIVTWNVKA